MPATISISHRQRRKYPSEPRRSLAPAPSRPRRLFCSCLDLGPVPPLAPLLHPPPPPPLLPLPRFVPFSQAASKEMDCFPFPPFLSHLPPLPLLGHPHFLSLDSRLLDSLPPFGPFFFQKFCQLSRHRQHCHLRSWAERRLFLRAPLAGRNTYHRRQEMAESEAKTFSLLKEEEKEEEEEE